MEGLEGGEEDEAGEEDLGDLADDLADESEDDEAFYLRLLEEQKIANSKDGPSRSAKYKGSVLEGGIVKNFSVLRFL